MCRDHPAAPQGDRLGAALAQPRRQAPLVLVDQRKGETVAEPAFGFGVSVATAWRYVGEIIALLKAHSPKLHQADRHAVQGHEHVRFAVRQNVGGPSGISAKRQDGRLAA
jgi:hypothetical protein